MKSWVELKLESLLRGRALFLVYENFIDLYNVSWLYLLLINPFQFILIPITKPNFQLHVFLIFTTNQIHSLLSICSRGRGHFLGHGRLTRGHLSPIKSNCLSFSSYQLTLSPHIRWGIRSNLYFLLEFLTFLILQWSYVDNHSYWEFICVLAMSFPKTMLSQYSLISSDSYTFSTPLLRCSLNLRDRERIEQ